jgi:hypothetical protein
MENNLKYNRAKFVAEEGISSNSRLITSFVQSHKVAATLPKGKARRTVVTWQHANRIQRQIQEML